MMQIRRMGLIVALLLGICEVTLGQPRLGQSADILMKKTLSKATKEGKLVLLVAYSSTNAWSPYIHKLLNSGTVKPILSKYFVLCEINPKEPLKLKERENPGAKEMFDKYYQKLDGIPPFPSIFLLDQKSKFLSQFSGGFTEGQTAVKDLMYLLSKNTNLKGNDLDDLNKEITAAYRQNATPTAQDIIDQAVASAKTENKKALIIFHASWCHWCHVLDTALSQPTIKPFFAKNFNIRHITVLETESHITEQNPGAAAMLKKYQGLERNGIPYWMILGADGKLEADYNGFPDTTDETKYGNFEKILISTGGATAKELEEIKRVFTKIKNKS